MPDSDAVILNSDDDSIENDGVEIRQSMLENGVDMFDAEEERRREIREGSRAPERATSLEKSRSWVRPHDVREWPRTQCPHRIASVRPDPTLAPHRDRGGEGTEQYGERCGDPPRAS